MLARGRLQYKYTQARKAKTYHILRDKGRLSLRKIKGQNCLRTAQIGDCKKIREKRSSQAELTDPPPYLTPHKLIPLFLGLFHSRPSRSESEPKPGDGVSPRCNGHAATTRTATETVTNTSGGRVDQRGGRRSRSAHASGGRMTALSLLRLVPGQRTRRCRAVGDGQGRGRLIS